MTETHNEKKSGEHPMGDTGQLILFALFLIIWTGDSFFLHASTFLSAYVPLYVRLIMFGLMLMLSVFLVRSGHGVVPHQEQPKGVVSTGAFRYVRHPLYLGSMLFYLSLILSTFSLLALVLFGITFMFYNWIANYEEKLLEIRFGEEYRHYKGRTGKWIPRTAK